MVKWWIWSTPFFAEFCTFYFIFRCSITFSNMRHQQIKWKESFYRPDYEVIWVINTFLSDVTWVTLQNVTICVFSCVRLEQPSRSRRGWHIWCRISRPSDCNIFLVPKKIFSRDISDYLKSFPLNFKYITEQLLIE